MAKYCVSRRPLSNGDHDVHNLDSGCPYLPNVLDQLPLGEHDECKTAVQAALLLYDTANGCYNCSTGCHVDREARRSWVSQALGD